MDELSTAIIANARRHGSKARTLIGALRFLEHRRRQYLAHLFFVEISPWQKQTALQPHQVRTATGSKLISFPRLPEASAP